MAAENNFSGNKEENLYLLHNEIEKLTTTCLDSHISYFQIKKAANPFLTFERKKETSKQNLRIFCVTATVVLLIAVSFYVEPTKRLLHSYGRHSLIKVLPLFDWTSLHGVNCFIPNYFNEGDERPLQAEDCQNCSRLTKVDVLSVSSMEVVANDYLYKDRPVIVQDSGQGPARVELKDIVQLYSDNEIMRLYTSCYFESNIKVGKKDHRRFLRGVHHKLHSQFYAHWENCFKEAAKLFRSLYRRPDFLPTSVELTSSNWIFMCSNYTENKNILLPFEEQVIVLIQLSGELDIKLSPREQCSDDCKSIHASIPEGGAMFVTDFFYDIEYVTCNHGNSITVGLGGKLDI